MKNNVGLFAILVLVVLIAASAVLYFGKSKGAETGHGSQDTAMYEEEGDYQSEEESGLSNEYKEKLAKYLTEKGAVLYGAYWCSHCKQQKQLFGDAYKYVNYVECDPAGENANPDECKAKEIEGFPTWIYKGEKLGGTRQLEDLASWVGFSETNSGEPSGAAPEGLPVE